MKVEPKHKIKEVAKYLAICVRNNMEDYHCEHLTDLQMKELNPLIRNAIYTGLHAMHLADKGNKMADKYIRNNISMIPDYWESPELTGGYKDLLKID